MTGKKSINFFLPIFHQVQLLYRAVSEVLICKNQFTFKLRKFEGCKIEVFYGSFIAISCSHVEDSALL